MNPFGGVLVWLWNLPRSDGGDPAAIVARLRSVGAAGLLIKVADGSSGFNDWNQVKALVAALRAAGLSACTWSYHYDGSAAEAAAVTQAVMYCGSDGHVFDVEAEFEALAHPNGAALALIGHVRSGLSDTRLGYAPIGSIRNHLRAPYRQFTDAGFVMLPQTYYAGFGWTPQRTLSEFYADVATYQLAQQPIYPAYEDSPLAGIASTAADVAAFCQGAKAAGAAGVSVWAYEHLDAAGWQRVAAACEVFPHVGVDPCAERIADLEAQVLVLTQTNAGINAEAARLHAAVADMVARGQAVLS